MLRVKDQAVKMNSSENPLKSISSQAVVVGAGLAGCECAWQMAERGVTVTLIEQRPHHSSPAHKTNLFGELVCSNSLKSNDPLSAPGLLKNELQALNSLVLKSAFENKVAAGQALAVERNGFSQAITQSVSQHPNIRVIHHQVTNYNDLFDSIKGQTRPTVFATGPLGAPALMDSLKELIGESKLSFFDAISPIVDASSIDFNKVYKKNRYDKVSDEGSVDDYINCPFSKEEYFNFIEAIQKAEKVENHSFEKIPYFQGCQPIEAMIERGPSTLAHGPMKPMGLEDPRTGKRPFAVVQLRKEDNEGRSWNIVGFQTKMKYPEQKRIFQTIPGLENAEFYRLGSIHRNTYIKTPALLNQNFALNTQPNLFFAGQITGVEGYLESTAIGAYVGLGIYSKLKNNIELPPPPQTTALGALAHACFAGSLKNFQPMNINWGLVPLNGIDVKDKSKKEKLVERAQRNFKLWSGFINA